MSQFHRTLLTKQPVLRATGFRSSIQRELTGILQN